MTILQLFNFYKNKPANTKICKEFMNWCSEDINRQQIIGGYIELAKKKRIEINYAKGHPNQKWHLLYSYCYNYKHMKGTVGELKCPELIIWMCEAACIKITSNDIEIMKNFIVEQGRAGRNTAGQYLWDKYKNIIIEKVNKYGT